MRSAYKLNFSKQITDALLWEYARATIHIFMLSYSHSHFFLSTLFIKQVNKQKNVLASKIPVEPESIVIKCVCVCSIDIQKIGQWMTLWTQLKIKIFMQSLISLIKYIQTKKL